MATARSAAYPGPVLAPEQLTWPPARLTLAEFLPFVEGTDRRWQLVEGEVVVTEASDAHQRTMTRLLAALFGWEQSASGFGHVTAPVDTAAGPRSWIAPDVQWWADPARMNDARARPQPLGDLAVEIRSPSTGHVDEGPKRTLYERLGLRELWLVDPEPRTVRVLGRSTPDAARFDVDRLLSPSDELTSPLLPGFSLAVASAFD